MREILFIRRGLICMLCFIVSTSYLKAQPPGYLGRRFILQANLEGTLGLLGTNKDGKGGGEGLWLSTRYGARAEFVTSRHRSIFLSYERATTGVDNNYDAYSSNPFTLYPGYFSDFYELKISTIAFGTRIYSDLAPMGGYFQTALEYNMLKANLITHTPDISLLVPINKTRNLRDIGLNLGFGYRYMIGKSLTIDWGANFRIPIAGSIALVATASESEPERVANPDNKILIRNLSHSAFMMHLGIGFMF